MPRINTNHTLWLQEFKTAMSNTLRALIQKVDLIIFGNKYWKIFGDNLKYLEIKEDISK